METVRGSTVAVREAHTLKVAGSIPAPATRSVLALNLGTHTGWALRSPSGAVDYGVQPFVPRRFDGGGMRFLRFKRWLTELKGDAGLATVYFEEVRKHVSTDSAHLYGGFLATLTAWCEHHEIPYEGINVATVKKFWTGKGNAKKESMIIAANRRGYHEVHDDNVADALAILHCGLGDGIDGLE